jgi:hypothetical protein
LNGFLLFAKIVYNESELNSIIFTNFYYNLIVVILKGQLLSVS